MIKKINMLFVLMSLSIMLTSAVAADADKFDEKYGMVTDYAALVAKEIKSKMSKHQLSEPEIYTLLSSLVSYDTRIWSASVAFTPSLLQDYVNSDWEGFDSPWHYYLVDDDKRLYAPYVWRANGNLLHADNLANPNSKFGYDYTDGQWAWWSKTIDSGVPTWGKPVYSSLTGDRMVTYSYPIERDAVLIFNVYYGI